MCQNLNNPKINVDTDRYRHRPFTIYLFYLLLDSAKGTYDGNHNTQYFTVLLVVYNSPFYYVYHNIIGCVINTNKSWLLPAICNPIQINPTIVAGRLQRHLIVGRHISAHAAVPAERQHSKSSSSSSSNNARTIKDDSNGFFPVSQPNLDQSHHRRSTFEAASHHRQTKQCWHNVITATAAAVTAAR